MDAKEYRKQAASYLEQANGESNLHIKARLLSRAEACIALADLHELNQEISNLLPPRRSQDESSVVPG